jgi:hypothetical protein
MEQAVAPQLREARRASDIQAAQIGAEAAKQGAFGGGRSAILEAERRRNLATQTGDIRARGLQQAYEQAQQLYGTEQQRALQAALANQQAGLTAGGQNLAAQLGVQQLGTQTGLQTALANLSSQQQANVQNQAAALQAQGLNAQQAMQAALVNQQAGLTAGQANLQALLGTQQFGAGQSLQAQLANQQAMQQAQQLREQSRQFGAGQGLQAAGLGAQYGLAAQQLGEQSRQFGAGQGLQAASLGAQYGQAAQQLGEQSRQFGAGLGLQGLNTALSAAGQLGQLGQQQFGQEQGIINLQSQLGAQQQALRQQGLTQAYQDFLAEQNYPYKQLGYMSDIIRGLPLGQQTTRQVYEAPPSAIQNIGSLGLGAYGLSRLAGSFKKGGVVRNMAEGGYAEIREKILSNPTKYSEEQIKQAVKNGVLDVKTAELALEQIAKAKQAAAGIDMLPSGLPTQEYAPGGIVAFDEGGDVKRYQYGGVTRWEDLKPYTGAEGIDLNRVRAGLEQYYGISGGQAALPRVSPPSLRGDVRIDPVTGKPITYAEFLTRQSGDPTAGFGGMPIADASPSAGAPPSGDGAAGAGAGAGEGYFGGIGGGRPPVVAPAAASDMSMDRILERAQTAGQRAVPAGLASLTLPTFTSAQYGQKIQEAMPEKPTENAMTLYQEDLIRDRTRAAQEALQESGKLSDRMDKLREAQAARFKAKEKDITADRDRTVGIAFLEAAEAMQRPGQTLMQSLARSGVAAGKSFMASKERLDKRADELSDAINRLDEARVGDARERATAQAQFNTAVNAAKESMVQFRQTAYNENKADARAAVNASIASDVAATNFQLNKQKAVLDAQQNAEANAIRAAQVGVAARGVEADFMRAGRPGPQLELALALGDGDAKKGMSIIALAQQDRVSTEKLWSDLLSKWEPLKMGREAPSYFEFLTMLGRTAGGQAGAKDTIRPRLDAMKP